jgi:uncharacterized protein (DUF433 family)
LLGTFHRSPGKVRPFPSRSTDFKHCSFPFTRAPGHTDEQPRFIVIDPRASFGRPRIDGTGIPTTAIYERYLAGDSPEHLAKDYERDLAEIHEAIRCESQ